MCIYEKECNISNCLLIIILLDLIVIAYDKGIFDSFLKRDNEIKKNKNTKQKEVSVNDLNNKLKKIFGDIDYQNNDIPSYGIAFGKINYLAYQNIYKLADTCCGGVCDRTIQYKIIKALKNDIQ